MWFGITSEDTTFQKSTNNYHFLSVIMGIMLSIKENPLNYIHVLYLIYNTRQGKSQHVQFALIIWYVLKKIFYRNYASTHTGDI